MSERAASEFKEFLDAFARSFESYEPAKIGQFIHCPCLFFGRDVCISLDSPGEIFDFIRTSLETFRASGCVHFKAHLLKERRVGLRYAFVDVDWSLESSDQQHSMHFTTTYQLVHDQGSWKVAVITRHDT